MTTKYNTFAEAQRAFAMDKAEFEARGVFIDGATSYWPENFKRDASLALDSIPGLNTNANSAVPAILTTLVDPTIYEILFAPNKAVEIAGEEKHGSWLDDTIMFPTVEHTGEVSSYGDYNNNGKAGANLNWPQRQSYLFQVIKNYGDKELERVGLSKINWVSELDRSAATQLNKFHNLTYFYGVQGLQNYGMFNDPNLAASLTPGVKAAGNGNVWVYQNAPNATANEIFTDVEALVIKLIVQTGGLVASDSKLTLALSPANEGALATTNSFGFSAMDMIKKNYPNLRVVSAVQYAALSSTNPQGNAGGNFMQLFADEVEGQTTVFCAYNEKMRAHPLFRDLSSYRQKVTSGSWGAIIRMPFAITSMIGI